MRHLTSAMVVVLLALSALAADLLGQRRGRALDDLLDRATRYVLSYEQAFSLLVFDEAYLQEIRRPPNPGTNLSRSNPGGGMLAGGAMKLQDLRSDFLLIQLGEGAGWMQVRDPFEVNATKLRDRDEYLIGLFVSSHPARFEEADRVVEEAKKFNIGSVERSVNHPTLAMMFLHPRVRERFAFDDQGVEAIDLRSLVRIGYRETARPTLIKTTRGRDLALTGNLWVDSATGTVVKTELNVADPEVRAQVTVTFRNDDKLKLWVPAMMQEYYKATQSLDEIFATATYTNARKYDRERY
jgi:hypothetical protein